MRLITILMLLFSSPLFAATNQQTFDERLFDAKISAVRADIDAMKEATKVYKESTDHRLMELNELRKEVVRDRSQYVQREIFDSKVKEYDENGRRLANLETRLIAYASALFVFFGAVNIAVHLWGLKRKGKVYYPEDEPERVR